MKFKEAIVKILELALPYLKDLIESKVVPVLKRKAYERLNDFASDSIEDLTELYESGYFMRDLENTPDSGIQEMIAHMENGGDARDFFRQELSEL